MALGIAQAFGKVQVGHGESVGNQVSFLAPFDAILANDRLVYPPVIQEWMALQGQLLDPRCLSQQGRSFVRTVLQYNELQDPV